MYTGVKLRHTGHASAVVATEYGEPSRFSIVPIETLKK